MFLCKKLLAVDWYPGTNLAKAQKSNQAHQKAAGITLHNGHYNTDVLEYMDGKKCMDF
jgi:hypothetical protein